MTVINSIIPFWLTKRARAIVGETHTKKTDMATIEHLVTAEELLELEDISSCELLRGEIVMMSPASFNHGWIAGNIYEALDSSF
jgi:hypothetical protein